MSGSDASARVHDSTARGRQLVVVVHERDEVGAGVLDRVVRGGDDAALLGTGTRR